MTQPTVSKHWRKYSNPKAPFTRYNLLSNRLSNRFDNRVNVCIHDTTGCQTRCQTGCQTRLTTGLTNGRIVYTVGCQTGLYNRFDKRVERTVCSFNTVVNPFNTVVKPIWQPVWQPVGCLFTRYSRLSKRLYNRFDNRLYRVNGV